MIFVLLAAATAASAPAPALAIPKPPPVDCRDADHRALDFWIGEWRVSDSRSGLTLATSRIEPVAGGCAVRETYDQTVGPGGQAVDYHGTSYTALDTLSHGWRQFYVDNSGAALAYTGGVQDGAMVLTATNSVASNRMTIAPQADGAVRQTGALSLDGGKTWQAAYDFTYRRR